MGRLIRIPRANVLRTADRDDKAQVYQRLALKLTYKPGLGRG